MKPINEVNREKVIKAFKDFKRITGENPLLKTVVSLSGVTSSAASIYLFTAGLRSIRQKDGKIRKFRKKHKRGPYKKKTKIVICGARTETKEPMKTGFLR